MLIKLDVYRKKKLTSKNGKVLIPIYEKVFIEGNKLIGQFSSGRTEIIHDYSKDS